MMKRDLLFLSVFLLFIACGNGNDASENSTEEAETTETSEESTQVEGEENKAEPSADKIGMEALVTLYGETTEQKFTIEKEDIPNGYMEVVFEGAPEGTPNCQFGYFVANDGTEILAITIPQCMMACTTSLLFYQMFDGELVNNQTLIEGYVDMNQFFEEYRKHEESKMTEEEKAKQQAGEMGLYNSVIEIPQSGTVIKCSKIANQEGAEPILIGEIAFDVTTGKFNFTKL